MVHREVREKVSKKETAIYHFDVKLNNYFTLVQEERKHLERGHHSLRILTNKIPSVFFFKFMMPNQIYSMSKSIRKY